MDGVTTNTKGVEDMIEIGYKDPYVLNCGHTYEKSKAKALLSCEECFAVNTGSEPNFALKDLCQKFSGQIDVLLELQKKPESSSELEEHNSEYAVDTNDALKGQKDAYELIKQTNELVNLMWALRAPTPERHFWMENIGKRRKAENEAFLKEHKEFEPHTPCCIIL